MAKIDEGDQDYITKYHSWEELGWAGIKAITESLKTVGYNKLFSLRLWKSYIEDEGVRAICDFLHGNVSVLCLELMDNKITPLGCEFIGRTITPGPKCPPICFLKLDCNHFGSAGVQNLCSGLKTNEYIKMLSLCYCGIDAKGARPLFECLIYSKSKLEELILTGNRLKNEGAIMILRGVSIAKELKKIYLADNQFNEEPEMLETIKMCMTRNKTLAKYDFRYNDLKDAAIIYFTEMLGPEEEGKISHVTELECGERAVGKVLTDPGPPEVMTPYVNIFKDVLALNKPKKGKKGKGGKGKKKKK